MGIIGIYFWLFVYGNICFIKCYNCYYINFIVMFRKYNRKKCDGSYGV